MSSNEHEGRAGITLGICNQKGGVGKSSTAAALAAIYARAGYKVLVIDNDPQGNVSLLFGVDAAAVVMENDQLISDKALPTVADLYMERLPLEKIITPAPLGLGVEVDLVPATVDLAEVEMVLPSKGASDLRLRQSLKHAREDYDLIILDSPPNLGKLSLNVLMASDYWIVPVGGSWALRSVAALLKVANNNASYYGFTNKLAGVVMTMMNKTRIMQALKNAAAQMYPEHLLASTIRQASVARESETMSTPLPVYAPHAPITNDYKKLAFELSGRINLPVNAGLLALRTEVANLAENVYADAKGAK